MINKKYTIEIGNLSAENVANYLKAKMKKLKKRLA